MSKESPINHKEQPVKPEMLARIDAARAHPSPGIPHEEILRASLITTAIRPARPPAQSKW
jgi:hypothetical protein